MASAIPIPAPRWTIAPYETGGSLLARHAHVIAPREDLSVSAWAIRDGYDPEVMPPQMELMDALSAPVTSEVGYMGPVQIGKSEIGTRWIGWSIDHSPTDMLMCQADKAMAQDFVERRIDPMIDGSKALKSKLAPVANANNIFQKKFRGMLLTTIWPVAAQFASRPVARGWIDELDLIPKDIEGKGSAIKLLDGRQTTHEGRDTKFVSSSPADEEGGGIEAFVESGTDERLQPTCPECGDRIETNLIRDLRFDGDGTPEEAEASAHVVCPANGCILSPHARRAMIAGCGELPARGWVASRPEASQRRRTFRHDGLLAFTSWTKLAREWREAVLAWTLRQDEGPLRVFYNTRAGQNYRSILSGEKPIRSEDLRKRRDPTFQLGTVPAGVKTIVVLVDAQANGFQCAAIGWGDDLQCWIIDRWAIEVLEDGLTSLTPFAKPEHAEMLLPLWNRTWPLADGSGQSPPPLCVAIDTGGGGTKGESWTASVKELWHKAVKPLDKGGWGIHRSRVVLLKGGNKPNAKMMPPAEFSDREGKGKPKRNAPQLWMPNVHKIKNILDARLRREAPGPGYIHFPGADRPGAPKRDRLDTVRGLEDEHFDEITSEELKKGRWEKIRARNETWDHLVYAYAVILMPGRAQSRTDMRWVPKAYRVPEQLPQLAMAAAPAPEMPSDVSQQVSDDVRQNLPKPAAITRQRTAVRAVNPLTRQQRGSFLRKG